MSLRELPGIIVPNLLSAASIILLLFICCFLVKNYCSEINRASVLGFWVITSLLGLIVYCIIVFNRDMKYVSDYTVYYDLQFEMMNLFKRSTIKGLYGIISSCWRSDYSYFISVFLFFPFSLANKSHECFVIVYYIVLVVPVFLSMLVLACSIAQKLEIKNIKGMLALISSFLILFPLLHFASILGMPDIFGLFFAFAIITILINYDFQVYNSLLCIAVSILSVMLVFTRRWYTFWLAGFMSSFFVAEFFSVYFNKHDVKKNLLNWIRTAGTIFFVLLLCLTPFVVHNLFGRNYSQEYAAWYKGGFPYEIMNQIGFLGVLFTIVLGLGLLYGLFSGQLRIVTFSCLLGFFITVFLFTRIQNMGKHQSLSLVPYYFLLYIDYLMIGFKAANNRLLKTAFLAFPIAVLLLNALSSIFMWYDDLEGIFWLTKYAVSSRFVWTF